MKNIIMCLAILIACGKPNQSQPPSAAEPIRVVDAAVAAIPDAAAASESASAAVAMFKNNRLINCTTDVVSINGPSDYKPDPDAVLGVASVARLLLDDARAAMDSTKGDALLASKSGKSHSWISEMLLVFAVGAKQVGASAESRFPEVSKKKIADVKQMFDASELVDGEVVVDSCDIPGHMVFGTCIIEDKLIAQTKAAIAWRVTRVHFDVSTTEDSDSSMLACLQLGGKWTAPAKNDPSVVQERLHQHATQLKQLTGH